VECLVKLVLSITRDEDATRLIDALVDHEYRATRINTAGGFLKKGNSTVVVGVEDDRVDDILGLIRQTTEHANVFVLNVKRFERL
jgi:uncharacterized protein YaaQ